MKAKLFENKWLIATIALAVVAVAAIVVAIVLGVSLNTSDDRVFGVGEEGVYYYEVVDGEVILTLRDGTFTLSGAINKTGVYSVDGSAINLDFYKDEDGTASATLNGDALALVYNNANMSFLKDIDYTVSFDVDGGSEISSIKVTNGKTVTKPAVDPTKANNVFLGWYADESCTTPFAFDEVTVKSDLTVYAKWAEKQAGVPDYVVSFDLGYTGGEAMAPITTVSGVAYGIENPTREGYTFGGWWISMYDDGNKLSYIYKEGYVFTADTTLYALWYDNASTKLNAPAVNVEANKISWDPISGAASYKLTVINPDGTVAIDNETVTGTIKEFDFAPLAAGEYKISVVAVANNQDNNSDPAERSFANKTLDKVTDFYVENGILVFGAVENAEKYIITIDCGNDNHTHTNFDNGSSTIYYLGNCQMQSGGILITVTASANGYASSVSKVFAYDKTLGAVENLKYDAQNDKFVWSAVAGAASYKITVTIGTKTYTIDNGSLTSFSVAGYTGEINLSVVPVSEGYNSPAATTASCTKTAPAAPGGVNVVGSIISWNAVEGAVSYEISIGDQTITTEQTSVNIASASITLTQGQIYNLKVKAINANNESSSYSESIEVGYFALSPIVLYSKNTVTWSGVLGVNQYQIRINGGEVITVTDANSAKVTLTKEGENLIEVRYIYGETVSDWASVTVNAFAVEYDSRTAGFGSVLVEYLAIGDEMTLPSEGFSSKGYTFTGWYNTPKGAAGNGKMFAEGATFQGNAYTVVYAEWTPVTYNLTLKTDGLGFTITNIANGAIEYATYTKHFTLTVPEAQNTGMYFFAGWYTAPGGTGTKITNELGESVAPYSYTQDITLYPYYSTNALNFTLQEDNTYAVSKGETIGTVTNLKIPVTYNEIPVTVILENAFSSCSTILTVEIPDTIKLVGTGAFNGCTNLASVDVYVAYPDKEGQYETFYSDDDGVLIREDMGTTWLEYFPRAKTGEYTIPATVEKILPKAFYYSKISKVTIPKSITDIPEYAFYQCYLTDIVFEGGREAPVSLVKNSFYYCDDLLSITLPSKMSVDFSTLKNILNTFTLLVSINVEKGGEEYSSIGGMLTDADEKTILYCPRGYAGDITIPVGVTGIGEYAFQYCDNITSVTIPVWVTNIGKYAFQYCEGIASVTFAGKRSEDLMINEEAFWCLYNLQTITFEGNGTDTLDKGKITMGKLAFYGSSSSSKLHTVTIGDGVYIESIAQQAFQTQGKLREFNISEKAYVGSIGEKAFEKCVSLTSFKIPATVTSVAANAFNGCTKLSTLEFATAEGEPELVLASSAFNGCISIREIELPDRLSAFEASAFEGCSGLKSITVKTTNTKYTTENGILYTKNVDENDNVVFTELLFYPKALVKENNGVIDNLPSTLTTIGGSAFSDNAQLKKVVIPEGVTTIGNYAFANCENLNEIVFNGTAAISGEKTLTVGDSAFLNCKSITNDFLLPSYTVSIGTAAFQGCEFTEFVIPEGVTYIGMAAFWGSTTLEYVEFRCTGNLVIADGSNNTAAKGGAFSNCTALTRVDLPAGLTELGNYTFYKAYALRTVNIGTVTVNNGVYTVNSKLTRIGNRAFEQCVALESIIIPKSVVAIGSYAFAATEKVTTAGNPGQGHLSTVIFEEGGTEGLNIATYAFQWQSSLKKIDLPERVTLPTSTSHQKKNGSTAIKDVNNNNVYVAPPATSTYQINLLKQVFNGCLSLAEINIVSDDSVTGEYCSIDGVLYSADKSVLLLCPAANVGAYKNGEPTYELVIPNTVKLVITFAFNDCTALKTLTFEEFDKTDSKYGTQLLTIGNYTYSSASATNYITIGGANSAISTVKLPSHLKEISYNAFVMDDDLSAFAPMQIIFNQDAKNVVIEKYAFYYSTVQNLALPGIKSIGDYAFAKCSKLESISFAALDSGVKKLPNYMLQGASALTRFDMPAQITEIGTYVFDACSSLSELTITDKVTKFGNYAFRASGLTSFTIYPTVQNAGLGTNLFENCVNLTKVYFAPVESTGKSPITQLPNSIFSGCSALTDINIYDISAQLTKIGNSAFKGCASLAEIDFTKFTALTTLGTQTFSNIPSIVRVDLSKTKVTAISTAFNNLANLEEIILPESLTTNFTSASFTNDPKLARVYLPKSFKTAWIANLNSYVVQKSDVIVDIKFSENSTDIYIDEFGVVYDPDMQLVYFANPAADLSEYTLPDSVIQIAAYAFAHNKSLKNLVIHEGVTTIDKYAFYYSGITSIVIPSTVTTIGDYAFQHADLEKVTFVDTAELPSNLTTLGTSSFSYTKLVDVVLPDKLTTIGNYAFGYNYYIKSITTGAAMKEIPNGFVAYTPALEHLYMQEGIETIRWIFSSNYYIGEYGAHKMTSIDIPASVKTLESDAFCDMVNLKTVNFANGSALETIGAHAFRNCIALEEINGLPASVATIGKYAFSDCVSLKTLDLSATSVTEITEYAFNDTESMTTISLPTGLTTIGTYAFFNTGVKDLYVPAGVMTIGASAFEDSAIESVTFPTSSAMTSLGDTTAAVSAIFRGTANLKTVTLPNILKSIANNVFENSAIESVVMADASIPSSLNYIGASAFANCANLTSFAHLEQVTEIGEKAFFCCSKLENTVVSEGLTTLGAMAFAFTKITDAYIPSTLGTLGGNPYAGIAKEAIRVSDESKSFIAETDENGVLYIYDTEKTTVYAVFGATGKYEIPASTDNATYAPGALAGNAITEANVPARLATVPDYMFMNCTQLASVELDDSLTAIGQYAFYNTALTTFTFPAAATSIGDCAFMYCASIDNVVMPKTILTVGNYVFAYCTALSNFEFEKFAEGESVKAQTIGTHFFYNCQNITKVVLPEKIAITADDKTASGSSYTTDIPSYMFAGTGIVNAVIPETSTDFYYFTRGVFANCKELVTVLFEVTPDASFTSYGSGNPTFFEGCDKLEALYVNSLDKSASVLAVFAQANWPELHIKLAVTDENTLPLNSTAYVENVMVEGYKVVFDASSYTDIIEYFSKLNKTWIFELYDMNGNRLYCSADNGSIAYVENAQGEVIWGEKPAN